MVSAVLLAGGKVKQTLRDKFSKAFYKQLYGEDYLWGSYKPLKEVKIDMNGETKSRPMTQYVLDTLDKSKTIDEIIIVGEKDRLEDKLELDELGTRTRVVQQIGSLVENAMVGYSECVSQDHALFVPCDIPKASADDIDSFVNECSLHTDNYDAFYGVTSKEALKEAKPFSHRPYLWVIDEDVKESKYMDKHGRRGFRLANLAFADLRAIGDTSMIDVGYSVRKLLNPLKIAQVAYYALPEVYRYFTKQLIKRNIEEKISKIIRSRFKLIEVDSAAPSLDIDAKRDLINIERYGDTSYKKRKFRRKSKHKKE